MKIARVRGRENVCVLAVAWILASCNSPAYCQILDWAKRYEGFPNYVYAFDSDRFGHVVAAGQNLTQNGTFGPFLDRYDATGALIWSRHPDLQQDSVYSPFVLSLDDLGNSYLASPYQFAKYNSAGDLQWTRDVPRIGAISGDNLGNVYTVRTSSTSANAYYVSKYDSAGILAWNRTLEATVVPTSISVSPDNWGNVFLLSRDNNSTYSQLSKFDATGNWAWSKDAQQGQPGILNRAIAGDGFGNLYALGQTTETVSGASRLFESLSKYGPGGSLIWSREGASGDSYLNLGADVFGNIYVSGGGFSSMRKFDRNGSLVWTSQSLPTEYGGVRWRAPGAIVATGESGAFYVVGETQTQTNLLGVDTILRYVNSSNGDYNRDGLVDAADYIVERKERGRDDLKKCSGSDGNCNGFGDNADYYSWRVYFGAPSTLYALAGAEGTDLHGGNVPEPNSAFMIGFGFITIIRMQSARSHLRAVSL